MQVIEMLKTPAAVEDTYTPDQVTLHAAGVDRMNVVKIVF